MKSEVSLHYPTHPVRGSALLVVCYLYMYTERCIDGDVFCGLSREDLAIIFPEVSQFILGVKLYRLIQKMRKRVTADSDITSQDSDIGSVFSSKTSSAQKSAKNVSQPNTSVSFSSGGECSHSSKALGTESRKRSAGTTHEEFTLPEFSPDVQQAIKADQFFTAAKRNKLIREACRAYKGYFRSAKKDITSEDKRKLGKLLYSLAPKSLGDPEDLAVLGVPEVLYVCAPLVNCIYIKSLFMLVGKFE